MTIDEVQKMIEYLVKQIDQHEEDTESYYHYCGKKEAYDEMLEKLKNLHNE